MTQKERKTRRNIQIKEDFQKLHKKKGKAIRYDYHSIIEHLSHKYFLSPKTIYKILKS